METNRTNRCSDFSGHTTVCAQCGYRFVRGEEALWIEETGDIVHADCFRDYAEDNVGEFTQPMKF